MAQLETAKHSHWEWCTKRNSCLLVLLQIIVTLIYWLSRITYLNALEKKQERKKKCKIKFITNRRGKKNSICTKINSFFFFLWYKLVFLALKAIIVPFIVFYMQPFRVFHFLFCGTNFIKSTCGTLNVETVQMKLLIIENLPEADPMCLLIIDPLILDRGTTFT